MLIPPDIGVNRRSTLMCRSINLKVLSSKTIGTFFIISNNFLEVDFFNVSKKCKNLVMCAFFSKVWRTLVFADSYKIMISCKVTSSKALTISDKVFKSYCEAQKPLIFLCVFQKKKTLWVISVFLLIGKMALNIELKCETSSYSKRQYN